jgi:hypothetical protein
MTNPLNLNAPVDTLAMELTRDFNAPVEALFGLTPSPTWSSSGSDRVTSR